MTIDVAAIQYRNAAWAHADNSAIYVEILMEASVNPAWAYLEGLWVPFGASPDDPEEYGRLLFARLVAEGNVAPYTPPEPTP